MDLMKFIYNLIFPFVWITSRAKGRTVPLRTFATNEGCNHLQNNWKHYNAYSHSSLGGSFCCLCPPGTKWVDDCSPANPSSTKCEARRPDHFRHIEHQPRLEPDYHLKKEVHCPPPKFYYTAPHRTDSYGCVCPDGMYENMKTGICERVSARTRNMFLHPITMRTNMISPISVSGLTITETPEFVSKDSSVSLSSTSNAAATSFRQVIVTSVISLILALCVIVMFLYWITRKKNAESSSISSSSNYKLNDEFTDAIRYPQALEENRSIPRECLRFENGVLSVRRPSPPTYNEAVGLRSNEEQTLLGNRDANHRCSRDEGFCEDLAIQYTAGLMERS